MTKSYGDGTRGDVGGMGLGEADLTICLDIDLLTSGDFDVLLIRTVSHEITIRERRWEGVVGDTRVHCPELTKKAVSVPGGQVGTGGCGQ